MNSKSIHSLVDPHRNSFPRFALSQYMIEGTSLIRKEKKTILTYTNIKQVRDICTLVKQEHRVSDLLMGDVTFSILEEVYAGPVSLYLYYIDH